MNQSNTLLGDLPRFRQPPYRTSEVDRTHGFATTPDADTHYGVPIRLHGYTGGTAGGFFADGEGCSHCDGTKPGDLLLTASPVSSEKGERLGLAVWRCRLEHPGKSVVADKLADCNADRPESKQRRGS